MLKLLVETNKKLNELTRAELASVHWKSVMPEEYDHVDVDTYRKLNANGRTEVNAVVDKFSTRPEEYWDEVLKHKLYQAFVENFLGQADDMKTMYHRYEDMFNKYISAKRLYDMGLVGFAEYVRADGYNVLDDAYSYYIMLDPAIPELEYLVAYNDEKSVLQHLVSEMREFYCLDDYPILVSNELLSTVGLNVPDFSEDNMRKYDACCSGREFVQKWKSQLGLTDKDVLTWDIVVKYIRENPSTVDERTDEGEQVVEYLNWWWEATTPTS